jgi:hypothetical protein
MKLKGNSITIQGQTLKVRYTYQREDGTVWHVLNTLDCPDQTGPGYGDFGDEWPDAQVC